MIIKLSCDIIGLEKDMCKGHNAYRLWLDGILLTEKKYLYDLGFFIREYCELDLPIGEHHLILEPVKGKIILYRTKVNDRLVSFMDDFHAAFRLNPI